MSTLDGHPFQFAFCKPLDEAKGLPPGEYVMEPKLDGFRLMVHFREDGLIESWTRTFHSATGKAAVPEQAILRVPVLSGTILDGEAVAFDESGAADFNYTARIMGSGLEVAVGKQRQQNRWVSFVAFDILKLQGNDVRHLPLVDRRKLLQRVVDAIDNPHVRITEQVEVSIEAHHRFTKQYGEGSVIKDLNARYFAGRSKAMLKWKKVETEDVVIMGSVPGKGKFKGLVGAVIFGQYKDGELVERGQCSGMTDAERERFTGAPGSLHPRYKGAVMEITHNGVLAGGGFRHPQFARLRAENDKRPEECEWS